MTTIDEEGSMVRGEDDSGTASEVEEAYAVISPIDGDLDVRTGSFDVRHVPDPVMTPTLSVERAGALFGLGRTKAYQEARRFLDTDGRYGIPTIQFGNSLRCPTAPILKMLGLEAARRAG